MRILLVEDDESIIDIVTTVLAQQNYILDTATDGEMGWELAEAFPYDLMLLDIVLPKLDGISLCRRLRDHRKQCLVMLLTARDAMSDKLIGLQAGADDYLVKPFDVQELSARIHALLRRGNPITETILRCGDLSLNSVACEVTYGDQLLRFSRKEYLLIELFLRHQNRVFSRSAIVDQIWSFNEDPPNEDTVKSHIKSIRRKLDAVGAGNLIETLYGQGYRINPSYLVQAKPTPATDNRLDSESQAKLTLSMSHIWQRTKGVNLERVACLDQAVQAISTAELTPELQQAAIHAAHKLVGSLGTFGFKAGSKIAQQFEATLQQFTSYSNSYSKSSSKPTAKSPAKSDVTRDDLTQLEGWVQSLRHLVQQNDNIPANDSIPALKLAEQQALSDSNGCRSQSQPCDLLVLTTDQDWVKTITPQVFEQKLRLVVVTTVAAAIHQCQQIRPQMALIDLACLEQQNLADRFLELLQFPPLVPVIFLSEKATAQVRLNAVQAGGQLFLQKSTSPTRLQAALKLLHPAQNLSFQILLVDDDPLVAKLLEVWLDDSIHLNELTDPTQFWEVLQQINPDLLILDVNMPDINGIELCQTVRCDPQWNWLPIIFLTAQTDPQIEREIFMAGADDLIVKPIRPEEFSIRIWNRLRRNHLKSFNPAQSAAQ